jgi:hypothetical protein
MLIPKDISIEDVESYYEKLVKEVSLPNGFKSLRIGIVPRLAQLLITLSKHNRLVVKFPWVALNDLVSQQNIVDDPVCVAGLLMTDDVYGKDNELLKQELNSLLVKRFNESIYKRTRKLQMMAVDHSIKKYAQPNCFYSDATGSTVTKDANHYFNILENYLDETAKNNNVGPDELASISDILAELIDNTEQHAKSDYTSGKSERSIRGIVLNTHTINKSENISSIAGNDTPIFEFLSESRSDTSALHLLEISIFDSGPGIYSSYLGREESPSIEDEVEVVTNSFLNGITSKINGIGVGRGLNRTRLLLGRLNGYISLRSGRLSIYRDFKNEPLAQFEEEERDIDFYDEETKTRNTFTRMKNVEGLSYTILVPLK